MNKIKKIIAGGALLNQLLFSSYANAQEQKSNVFLPTKISTETSATGTNTSAGIPFHRTELGNDYWTFKYDLNMKLKPSDCPLNVGMFSLNKIYSKNNTTIGAEVFQAGKFDGKDTWFFDAWVSKKFKDISIMLDAGKAFPSEGKNKDYVIASLKHSKISASAAYYAQGSTFEKNVEIRKYGYLAYHDNNIYAVAGNNVKTTFALASTFGIKNFGHITYALHNRITGDVSLKSSTAIDNVNEQFFCISTLDLASDVLALPMFQPLHFGPLSTKGNYALKLEYKHSGATKTNETEVMLATKKIPFIQIGLGLNSEHTKDCTKSNVAIELYKEVKFGKFKGSGEFRYNNRNHQGNAYLKMSRTF